MNQQSLVNAATAIVARNANERLAIATVLFDEAIRLLSLTYFLDGEPTDTEAFLCDVACAELVAEFPEVAEIECVCRKLRTDTRENGPGVHVVYRRSNNKSVTPN